MDSAEPSPTGFLLHVGGSFYQFLAMSLSGDIGWKQDTDRRMHRLDSKVALELAAAGLVVFCRPVVKTQSCRGLAA